MKDKQKIKQARFRNTFVFVSVLVLLTPFIFISNLYPFMRFGMFAEKVDLGKGVEVFEVRLAATDIGVTKKDIAISDFMLNYLVRNYYYKGEINTCAKKLYSLSHQPICIYKKNIIEKAIKEELIYCYPND
jgi:hypothetical protein